MDTKVLVPGKEVDSGVRAEWLANKINEEIQAYRDQYGKYPRVIYMSIRDISDFLKAYYGKCCGPGSTEHMSKLNLIAEVKLEPLPLGKVFCE